MEFLNHQCPASDIYLLWKLPMNYVKVIELIKYKEVAKIHGRTVEKNVLMTWITNEV